MKFYEREDQHFEESFDQIDDRMTQASLSPKSGHEDDMEED